MKAKKNVNQRWNRIDQFLDIIKKWQIDFGTKSSLVLKSRVDWPSHTMFSFCIYLLNRSLFEFQPLSHNFFFSKFPIVACEPYANRTETHDVRSTGFKQWLHYFVITVTASSSKYCNGADFVCYKWYMNWNYNNISSKEPKSCGGNVMKYQTSTSFNIQNKLVNQLNWERFFLHLMLYIALISSIVN